MKDKMTEDFETIYEKDKIFGDYLKCNHCGEKVERGIVTVSHHWMHCLKRKDGLIIAKNDLGAECKTEAGIVLFMLMCIAVGFSAALIGIIYLVYRLLI